MKPTEYQQSIIDEMNKGIRLIRKKGARHFCLTNGMSIQQYIEQRTVNSMIAKKIIRICQNESGLFAMLTPAHSAPANDKSKAAQYVGRELRQTPTRYILAAPEPTFGANIAKYITIAKPDDIVRKIKDVLLVGLADFEHKQLTPATLREIELTASVLIAKAVSPEITGANLDLNFTVDASASQDGSMNFKLTPNNLQSAIILFGHDAPPPLSVIYGRNYYEGKEHVYFLDDDCRFVVKQKPKFGLVG